MTQHRPSYFADLKNFDVNEFTVIVTCADGLEAALQIELNSFGLLSDVLRAGRVAVIVDLAKFYHICLYSRVASRVLLPLGEYHFKQKLSQATTNQPVEVLDEDVPEALYQFASRIDWINLFGLEHRFAIRLSTDKRLSVNQQFATLRIKDAIADTFNRAFGARPDVDAKQPDFQIFATANHKFAEIFWIYRVSVYIAEATVLLIPQRHSKKIWQRHCCMNAVGIKAFMMPSSIRCVAQAHSSPKHY